MYGLLRVNLVCQVEHERATEAYREAAETWERLKAADDTARERLRQAQQDCIRQVSSRLRG